MVVQGELCYWLGCPCAVSELISQYNYVLSAALDVGTALSGLFIFLILRLPNLNINWWGTEVHIASEPATSCMAWVDTDSHQLVIGLVSRILPHPTRVSGQRAGRLEPVPECVCIL